jgi:quercetin dioxygenase-like cupin family protein
MLSSRRKLLRLALVSSSLLLDVSAKDVLGQATPNVEKTDRWFWVPGHSFTLKAVGRDTAGTCAWMVGENKPHEGVLFHQHANEDEAFYILDGRFEMNIGDQTAIGTPGSFFFGPRNIPHRWTNVGSATGRLLMVFTPSGIEKYFQGAGVPIKDPSERPVLDMQDYKKSRNLIQLGQSAGLTKTGEAMYQIPANGY